MQTSLGRHPWAQTLVEGEGKRLCSWGSQEPGLAPVQLPSMSLTLSICEVF